MELFLEMKLTSDGVRAGYIYSLIDYLDNHYQDSSKVLPKEMLKPLQTASLEDRLPVKYWEELLVEAIRSTGDHQLPLKVSAEATPKHWGIVSYVALTSKTLAEAALALRRVGDLIIKSSDITASLLGGKIHVKLLPREGRDNRTLAQLTLACWCTAIKRYTNQKSLRVDVHLNYERPPCIDAYNAIFGGEILFSQEYTQIIFPIEILSLEILYHEPETHKQLLAKAYHQLKVMESHQPEIITEVISILKGNLAKGDITIETTSRSLGITSRTLQYQLKKHNYCYKSIVDSVRKEFAKNYIQDPQLTLLDIALLLGFSEQSSFSKWFKKKFMQTPLCYRRQETQPH